MSRRPSQRRPLALVAVTGALLFLGSRALAAPAAAAADGLLQMPLGAPTPPPLGYLRFCARQPSQCGLASGVGELADAATDAARERRLMADRYWPVVFGRSDARALSHPAPPLRAGDALLVELASVNLRINRAIRRESDLAQYGARDVWTLPLAPGGSGAGDCKDFVLEKRRALVEAGLPDEDLAIAVAATRWGEPHAVLLVATDRGELVLDSLSDRVEPWRRLDYSWIARQAPGEPLAWVSLAGASSRRR